MQINGIKAGAKLQFSQNLFFSLDSHLRFRGSKFEAKMEILGTIKLLLVLVIIVAIIVSLTNTQFCLALNNSVLEKIYLFFV